MTKDVDALALEVMNGGEQQALELAELTYGAHAKRSMAGFLIETLGLSEDEARSALGATALQIDMLQFPQKREVADHLAALSGLLGVQNTAPRAHLAPVPDEASSEHETLFQNTETTIKLDTDHTNRRNIHAYNLFGEDTTTLRLLDADQVKIGTRLAPINKPKSRHESHAIRKKVLELFLNNRDEKFTAADLKAVGIGGTQVSTFMELLHEHFVDETNNSVFVISRSSPKKYEYSVDERVVVIDERKI